jgi:hypothetical protein
MSGTVRLYLRALETRILAECQAVPHGEQNAARFKEKVQQISR